MTKDKIVTPREKVIGQMKLIGWLIMSPVLIVALLFSIVTVVWVTIICAVVLVVWIVACDIILGAGHEYK